MAQGNFTDAAALLDKAISLLNTIPADHRFGCFHYSTYSKVIVSHHNRINHAKFRTTQLGDVVIDVDIASTPTTPLNRNANPFSSPTSPRTAK
jgi:hypothetical protein